MSNSVMTYEELLDNAPEYAEGVASLWLWSSNHDYPTPSSLFLDLIGYSEEHFGQPLSNLNTIHAKLGYKELGLLSEALNDYANRPLDVMEYVEFLLNAEGE